MTLITQGYLALQRDLHARYDYGRGVDAQDCLTILSHFLPKGASVLDYGCGRGVFGDLAAQRFRVSEYDPAIPGKDQPPEPADGVVCADVLEHVEPDCLEAVLDDVRRCTKQFAVLIIATQPSSKIMADGRQAHILLQGEEWWRERITARFTILESEDRSGAGKGLLYILKPRETITDGELVWNEIGEVRTVMAVPAETRMEHTAANCARVARRLTLDGVGMLPAHDRTAVLACYGPSLRDSWQHIHLSQSDPMADVFSVSAAHAFLIERGIIPFAHIECDPRAHKAVQMGEPHAAVEYWLASCVHPDMLDRTDGHPVSLWHAYNGEDTRAHIGSLEPNQRVVVGGGSVGLRALSLLYYLGYRRFVLHGMDFSFTDAGEQHAGPHAGNPMHQIPVLLNGRVFQTSPALVSYFKQFFKQWQAMSPDVEFTLFGDGMLQHALKGHGHVASD